MRTLNLNEIEQKINSFATDIYYSDYHYSQDKITQFFNFLHEQPISKRILERIDEEYKTLKNDIPNPVNLNPEYFIIPDHRIVELVKSKLKNRQDQGAFGFFIIQKLFETEVKFDQHYLATPQDWYEEGKKDYNYSFKCLIEKFFKPFVELLEWYIYESKTKNENDYYSKNEIVNINSKLDEICQKQEFGNQILFNEIEELKELILFLNKKNWAEVVKGKFGDLVFSGIFSVENASSLYKFLLENAPLFLK
jgi:hypothetical protein